MWRSLGLVLLVVAVCAGVFAYQAWRARHDLLAARSDAAALQSALSSGDLGPAQKSADALAQAAARADGRTGNWLWAVAARVPVVGEDVSAVRTATAALHSLSADALPTLISLADKVGNGALRPHGGRLPLGPITQLEPQVQRAAQSVRQPATELDRVDLHSVVGAVARPVSELRDRVDAARTALDTAARVLRVLPAAAGAHGPRNYLLLFQNNAEIRATGGMAGSWAVLHAEHGRLTLSAQGSGGELDQDPPATAPIPATPAEKALYGTDLGTELRDANYTPDFPRYAAMAAGLVSRYTGIHLDGVFAVDPVALSYLLRGTGPVQVDPSTTLTADNAVQVLLNRVYLERTPAAQDAFFATAAQKIFAGVTGGHGDPLTTVRALAQGVQERRVLSWSPRPALARAIDHTAVAGALSRPGGPPQVGFFLNDSTGTKLEYYLRFRTSLAGRSCGSGRQRAALHATLRSTVPAHQTLTPSVTGPGAFAAKTTMILNVQVVAPRGGTIDALSVDGRPQTVAGGTLDGRQVAILPVRLRPGQRVSLVARLTFPRTTGGGAQLTTTPGLESRRDPVVVADPCR